MKVSFEIEVITLFILPVRLVYYTIVRARAMLLVVKILTTYQRQGCSYAFVEIVCVPEYCSCTLTHTRFKFSRIYLQCLSTVALGCGSLTIASGPVVLEA